jgi:AGZA family xanthine/uracil permease-like MFS transporter
LCLVGGVTLFLKIIPQECILGILLWIAIIITAQAFTEIPKDHGLAVAFGLIPAFAAFVLQMVVMPTLQVAGSNLSAVWDKFGGMLYIQGVASLSQGFLLTSMVFASMMVYMIERKFDRAAYWAFAAAVLSMTGLIHAFRLTAAGVENKFGLFAAPDFALIYFLVGGIFWMLHYRQKSASMSQRRKKKEKKADPPPPKSKVSYV